MYKVKIITGKNSNGLLQQTENGKGISSCGKYQFFIDEEIESPDFLVVRNKYIKSKLEKKVAPENTILTLSEPYSIVNFPKKYRDQFGLVCSCQEEISHHNIFYTPAILPWLVGVVKKNNLTIHSRSYDQLKASPFPKKTKLLSVITSNKAFTKGHQERINFVSKLKQHFGDQIDVFGRGFNDFNDKWDVLAPYKYHIALENSSSNYYWTEKLSDCFLAGTYPIYYGCKNIQDYFPSEAFTSIDIHDIERSIQKITEILNNDYSSIDLSSLEKCKELVLEDYNMFNLIAKYCDKLNGNSQKQNISLKPAFTMLDKHNFHLYFIERNILKLKSLFNQGNKI
jgi:hypothetical protein